MFKNIYGKIISTLGLSTILFSGASQALPIVEADAFAAGDNKAVLETSTGLTWMDFGVNSHLSYNHVLYLLPTEFAGWRLPTVSEVDHLWSSLFSELPEWNRFSPTFGSLTTELHDDYFDSIFNVFGQSPDATYSQQDADGNVIASWVARSLFAVFMEEGVGSGWVSLSSPYEAGYNNMAMYFDSGEDMGSWFGTLLVKDSAASVPEPGPIGLLLITLLALTARFRFKR